jgi:hypothetical protein
MAVKLGPQDVTSAWLGEVLAQPVAGFDVLADSGQWSHQWVLDVRLVDGARTALRLKVCRGTTFGRSEVDYYLRDYTGLADAPLVRCHDAQHEPGVGYHLLLDDLGATHQDGRDVAPTLAHGLAVATALGRMHGVHWQSRPAPCAETLDRYFSEVRPGVEPMEAATGEAWLARFDSHEHALRARWADPRGMTLLHGDLNPTNVLAPRGAPGPVIFLDRQPFDWSLTYGLALWDLAYFLVPWWPEADRRACELVVLRAWHQALARPDYTWDQVRADWPIAVAQSMDVPVEWCSKDATRDAMRWLWSMQLDRVRAALADHPEAGRQRPAAGDAVA